MLKRLLKRSQDAYAAFQSDSPQDSVLPNGPAAELDELAILGGRKSIITLRSASHTPAIQAAHSSGHNDSSRPDAAFDFAILADTVASPAMQNGSEIGEMSAFFMNHAGYGHQEVPAFNMPTFEHERRDQFVGTATYTDTSTLDPTILPPDEGYFMRQGEDMEWTMFAAQLLP